MNEIDKEIEQFKVNLNNIEKITGTLDSNTEKIIKIINETNDIELMKEDLKREIEKIDSINKDLKEYIRLELDRLNFKCDEIKVDIKNNQQMLDSGIKTIIASFDEKVSLIQSDLLNINSRNTIIMILVIIAIVLGIVNIFV